jgi:uncharacterized protein YaaW (UPF0174 family)
MMRSNSSSNMRLIELFKRVPAEDLIPLYELYDLPAFHYKEGALALTIRQAGSHELKTDRNYDEIVVDVAKKMKIKIDDPNITDEVGLERLVLQRVFVQYFDNLKPEERNEMEQQIEKLGMKMNDFNKYFLKASAGALVNILAQVNGRVLWQVLSGILRTIMARYAAGAVAYRAIGLFWAAVPFVNAALGAWLIWDLLGPAHRKTIPSVVQIALMRAQFEDSEPIQRNPYRCSVCQRDPVSAWYVNEDKYCYDCLPKATNGQVITIVNPLTKVDLRRLLTGYKFGRSNIYVDPNLHQLRKIRNIVAKYDLLPCEDVVVLIDNTFWGGASEGVVFGAKAVYFRNNKKNATGMISYRDFPHTNFEIVSETEIKAGELIIDAGCQVKSEDLFNMLTALKTKIQETTQGGKLCQC